MHIGDLHHVRSRLRSPARSESVRRIIGTVEEGKRRIDRLEKFRAAARLAAVVAHLEDIRGQVQVHLEDLSLPGLLNVSASQITDPSPGYSRHEGIVVEIGPVVVIALKSGPQQDLHLRISYIEYVAGIEVDHRNILLLRQIPDRVSHIPEPAEKRRIIIVRRRHMLYVAQIHGFDLKTVVPHQMTHIAEMVRMIVGQVEREFRVAVVQKELLERIFAVRHKSVHEHAFPIALDHRAVSPSLFSEVDHRDLQRNRRIRFPGLRGICAKLRSHRQKYRHYAKNSLSKGSHVSPPALQLW